MPYLSPTEILSLVFDADLNQLRTTAGSVAVSGLTVTLPAVLAVSGNVGQTAGPWAVSGAITNAVLTDVWDSINHQLRTSAALSIPNPLGVSGTVSIGNTPNVGQAAGPWAVSGSVSIAASKTLQTVAFAATGTTTIVAAVTSKQIKVTSVCLNCSAALTANWRDGASTTLTGAQSIAANGGYALATSPPYYLFATTAGNSLDLVLSGAGTCSGWVTYFAE